MTDDNDVAARIDDACARRWRAGWDDARVDRLAQVLTVPCPSAPYGCAQPAGWECQNVHGGGRLERQLAHLARCKAAGVALGPPVAPHEVAVPTRQASPEYQARRHYEQTGDDLPGYHQGRPWSPTGGDDQ